MPVNNMAPDNSTSLSVLRCISVRLSAVETAELPRTVANQVQNFQECKGILSQPKSSQPGNNEVNIVIHRLYTQAVALLQGRSVEERWSAAVLIKGLVEAGGYEILSKSKNWVTGLLNNLRKQDPPACRALYITTLTRIFILTRPYVDLIREITTPALPTFVKTCLGSISTVNRTEKELRTILESFLVLITSHPTIFRTHNEELGKILSRELGISAEALTRKTEACLNKSIRKVAAKLLVLSHCCEIKQGSAVSWEKQMVELIENGHRSLDTILFGVNEHVDERIVKLSAKDYAKKYMLSQTSNSRIKSINLNSERMLRILEVLTIYISTDSSIVTNFQIRELYQLVQRIVTAAVPIGSKQTNLLDFVPELSRDERDMCTQILPLIHVRTLHLIESLLQRFDAVLISLGPLIFQQVCWLFDAEKDHSSLRIICYRVLTLLVKQIGTSFGKESMSRIYAVIQYCCQDIRQYTLSTSQALPSKSKSSTTLLETTLGSKTIKPITTSSSEHAHAALSFLTSILQSTTPTLLPTSFRTLLDRTVLLSLSSHPTPSLKSALKETLIASILNPPKSKNITQSSPSLLPFLARHFPGDPVTEALCRPRAPLIQNQSTHQGFEFEQDGQDNTVMDVQPDLITEQDVTNPAEEIEEREQELLRPEKRKVDVVLDNHVDIHDSIDDSITKKTRTDDGIQTTLHNGGAGDVETRTNTDMNNDIMTIENHSLDEQNISSYNKTEIHKVDDDEEFDIPDLIIQDSDDDDDDE